MQWAISNNGFRSDSLYEKKIGEDLVFNNALPKSLTITQVACLKAKPKLHNGMVYRQFIMIPVEASCGCPKYANDVYMNIHNPNPNPNPKSLTPP